MKILDYQRLSTEDGPGLRTTLFTKGCYLHCDWCHNPESISPKIINEWVGVNCIGCLTCVDNCPKKALKMTEKGIIIDRDNCVGCGLCERVCPTGAIKMKGHDVPVQEIYQELIKDRAYFGSNGGITISGGEVMMQVDQVIELLKLLKKDEISVAIDTCGMAKLEDFQRIFPYADIFLFDLKLIDPIEHKKHTGSTNEMILNNFNYLEKECEKERKELWIRTPIIPGATDSIINIEGIAKFLQGKYYTRWELLAFNNLCRDKYERLYIDWKYKNEKLMTKKEMDNLLNIAKSYGLKEVYWTGATRDEKEEQ